MAEPDSISAAFRVTPQTIRNWRRQEGRPAHPWMPLAVRTLEHGEDPPPMTPAALDRWRTARGLMTYDATAWAFGLTRQAVHNWNLRGTMPRWVPLACARYDLLADAAPLRRAA